MFDPRATSPARCRAVAARAPAILAILLAIASGCSSLVTAPVGIDDPVEIFLLEEALHTGLVLPPDPAASGSPEQYVEFGYGDWSWYALGQDGWLDVFCTVLWPTQGTLCRRTFGAHTAAELHRRASWTELSPIVVSRRRAAELRTRLQKSFDAARRQVVVDRRLGFKFVPGDGSYWFADTCADAVAGWLQELGCDVGWAPVRAGLTVQPPPG